MLTYQQLIKVFRQSDGLCKSSSRFQDSNLSTRYLVLVNVLIPALAQSGYYFYILLGHRAFYHFLLQITNLALSALPIAFINSSKLKFSYFETISYISSNLGAP